MAYVDGFVVAVPASRKQAYLELASIAAKVFKENGATRVVECWGDDVPHGEVTDFHRSVKAGDGEVVVFSWIEFPSKEVRDRAHEKMHADERMKSTAMPFDGKRMIFGGFITMLDS